jgi:hypothetical protein
MPKRRDVISDQLQALADDLESLWRAATKDPKAEARRERAWTILAGVLSAASTMAARQLASRIWPILTGETPPTGGAGPKQQPQPSRAEERERETAATGSS